MSYQKLTLQSMEKYDWKDPKKELPTNIYPHFLNELGHKLIERDFWILLENEIIKLAKFEIDQKRFYISLNSSDIKYWNYKDIKAWAEVYTPSLPKPKEYALPKINGWWITRREFRKVEMNSGQPFGLKIDFGLGLINIFEIADHWTFFNIYTNEEKDFDAYLQMGELYAEFSSMIVSNSKNSKDTTWTHVAPSRNME